MSSILDEATHLRQFRREHTDKRSIKEMIQSAKEASAKVIRGTTHKQRRLTLPPGNFELELDKKPAS